MKELWYKNAIIYGLDVKTFQDSNDDGIGDLQGVIQRLDHLVDLGITCLWLLPFYPSPNRDNGYDVADFCNIHPDLGTLDDFTRLITEAHARGIRVIIDLVIHHTSTEHPWFKAARSSHKSKYRHYYIWSDKNPGNPHPGNAFPGPENDTWHYDEVANAWYFHQFYHFQPDLNFANKDVQEEVLRVVEFWSVFGVDGFRVDAAGLLFTYKGLPYTIAKAPGVFLKKLNRHVREHGRDHVLLGEADTQPEEMPVFFGKGDRMHMLLNFLMNQTLFAALARGLAEPVAAMVKRIPIIPQKTQWVNFVRNLDELNIDKLPVDEQQEVYAVFGKNKQSHIYERGLRRRVAPMMNNEKRLHLIFALLFGLPGTPLICYGDEIGMGENLALPERASVRTPMQWSDQKNAGFSTTSGKTIWPVITKGKFSYLRVNVEEAKANKKSIYHSIKRYIEIRKNLPILGYCRPDILPNSNPHILALHYAWKSKVLIAFFNLSNKKQTLDCPVNGIGEKKNHEILSDQTYKKIGGFNNVPLSPYGYRWFYYEKETKSK